MEEKPKRPYIKWGIIGAGIAFVLFNPVVMMYLGSNVCHEFDFICIFFFLIFLIPSVPFIGFLLGWGLYKLLNKDSEQNNEEITTNK